MVGRNTSILLFTQRLTGCSFLSGSVTKVKSDLSYSTAYGVAAGDKLGSGVIDKWIDRGYVTTSPNYAAIGMVESCDGDTNSCRFERWTSSNSSCNSFRLMSSAPIVLCSAPALPSVGH